VKSCQTTLYVGNAHVPDEHVDTEEEGDGPQKVTCPAHKHHDSPGKKKLEWTLIIRKIQFFIKGKQLTSRTIKHPTETEVIAGQQTGVAF
jgi:hypothetical protein